MNEDPENPPDGGNKDRKTTCKFIKIYIKDL
jgi:hypothetical protein